MDAFVKMVAVKEMALSTLTCKKIFFENMVSYDKWIITCDPSACNSEWKVFKFE